MTTKVHIENVGTFFIDPSKINELINWLTSNQIYHGTVSIGEISAKDNNQLING